MQFTSECEYMTVSVANEQPSQITSAVSSTVGKIQRVSIAPECNISYVAHQHPQTQTRHRSCWRWQHCGKVAEWTRRVQTDTTTDTRCCVCLCGCAFVHSLCRSMCIGAATAVTSFAFILLNWLKHFVSSLVIWLYSNHVLPFINRTWYFTFKMHVEVWVHL